MAGGLDRRGARLPRSLAERTGAGAPAPPHAGAGQQARSQPVPGQPVEPARPVRPVRHCWVVDPTGARAPGLLVEWRRSPGWEGRVAYVVDDAGEATLVEAWVPAEQLERRDGT